MMDDEPKPLEEHVKIRLYRSVRELIINAYKHSGAKTVDVKIRREGDEIQLTVEDDGRGFDVSRLDRDSGARRDGFGLFGIHERLRYIGGGMEIHSSEGRGTRITLRAPLETAEADGKGQEPHGSAGASIESQGG